MKIARTKDTGRPFRVANGQEIPNQGEATISGKSANGQRMKFKAQVADITKPLASANEIVDANNIILLAKEGGIVKKLSEDERRAVNEILKKSTGPMTPIIRRGGAFIMEIDVTDESDEGFEPAKKTFRAAWAKGDEMEVDAIVKGQWEAFWDCQDCGSFFHRQA